MPLPTRSSITLQAKLASAAKAKAETDVELRQVGLLGRKRLLRQAHLLHAAAGRVHPSMPQQFQVPTLCTCMLRSPALHPCLQAQEQLAVAQDEARELQDAVKAGRERAEAAELGTVALKAQLAEAKKEADARERALQVGCPSRSSVGRGKGCL